MKKRHLLETLAAHADALNAGIDITEELLARFPKQAARLRPLLLLARHMKAALTPLPAPAPFTDQLRRSLLYGGGRTVTPLTPTPGRAVRRPRLVWIGAATIGSLLSLAGVALLVARRLRLGQNRPLPAAV